MLGRTVEELRAAAERDVNLTGWLAKKKRFFEASEIQLIAVMRYNGLWPDDKPVPPKPDGYDGDLEFGLVPYWLNHPPGWLGDFVNHVPGLDYLWHWLIADWIGTHLTPELVGKLESRITGEGIIVEDGAILGTHTYDVFDSGWVGATLNYLQTELMGAVASYPQPTEAVTPIPATPRRPDRPQLRLALVSDWGTGPYEDNPAAEIREQILATEPDYLIHLGDVYYAGTNGDYYPPHEMTRNFLDIWPGAADLAPGRSFTLNGNHEMYAGGRGYFDVALQDNRFKAQRGVGYFALQFGGWTVVGLDSAYYSESFFYMAGNLGPADCPQRRWLAGLGLDPRRTIVLTHHNGLSLDGSAETALWPRLHEALGGDPAVWYWGHKHYGIAYKQPTATGRRTYTRCIGHGALPFGRARVLARRCGDAPDPAEGPCHCAYWVNTVDPAGPERERMRNGFATLDIYADGRLAESFFERGQGDPVFTHAIAAPED